ncbi:hypothetical protein C8T65DRAFT_725854 [Cerioporus squamosus]|nr:hypothetical protein C8T65DRAFT_725854 [Cerioporus squamosus]
MAYMPPECVHFDPKRKPSARKADMWALGLILLNMISGGIPWRRASRTSDTYTEFVDDPNYLLKCVPLSHGANRIIRRMLRANPLIRANISDVSAMIMELDTFWRPYDEPAPTEWDDLMKIRSTIASELEVHDSLSWAPNTQARRSAAMNRSAGSATTSATRCSSGRSTPKSTLVASPTGSVMMVKDMREKKDMGGRVRSLVSRVTRKFAMGSSS